MRVTEESGPYIHEDPEGNRQMSMAQDEDKSELLADSVIQ